MTPLRWELSSRQWDLLTGAVAVENYPAPIQVISHGRTALERARIREEVREELRRLGLLRVGRVDADLEAALRLLHQPASWLDAVWLPDAQADQPVRVLAARNGTAGVCALQHPADPGATVLDVIPAAGLADAVVSRLPAHPPGQASTATISLGPARDHATPHSGGVLVSSSPARTSAELELSAASKILNQPHTRTGQIAANVRERSGQVRRSALLRWCDNRDGRYQITVTPHPGNTRLLTVAPCDAQHLSAALRHLQSSVE
ncbi:MAG TPA: ESX secretion-associated protein EspG [Pseudonocardiaceae bacterium]|nr:ESX secretion-associated protein EspG [Pseudonocardiaceae bacterium]